MSLDHQHEEPEVTWASLFAWNGSRMWPLVTALVFSGMIVIGWIIFPSSDARIAQQARGVWGAVNARRDKADRDRWVAAIEEDPELQQAGFSAALVTHQAGTMRRRWDYAGVDSYQVPYACLLDRGCFVWPVDGVGRALSLTSDKPGTPVAPDRLYWGDYTGRRRTIQILRMRSPRAWNFSSFGTKAPGQQGDLATGVPINPHMATGLPGSIAATEQLFAEQITQYANLLSDLEDLKRMPRDFAALQTEARFALVRETWEPLLGRGFTLTCLRISPGQGPILVLEHNGQPVMPGREGKPVGIGGPVTTQWSIPLEDPSITWISREDIPIYLEDGSGPYTLSTLPGEEP